MKRITTGTSSRARVATFVPPLYPDELLFSFLGRLQLHRSLAPRPFNKQTFGRGGHISQSGLPSRLSDVADMFADPEVTSDYIALNHTMLPYITAYHPPRVRQRVRAAMANPRAPAIGAMTRDIVNLTTHFRFCNRCHDRMLREQGEWYWLRRHQLPIVTMCTDHGEPLRRSLVRTGKSLRGYVTPSLDNCPGDSPDVLSGCGNLDMQFLMDLSTTAGSLLANTDAHVDRSRTVEKALSRLGAKGYLDAAEAIEWELLRPTIDRVLAGIVEVFPELAIMKGARSVPSWLPDFRSKAHRTSTTMVMIAERIIEAAPRLEKPFGEGPWPCLNLASDHFNKPMINGIKRRMRRPTGLSGVFECHCGFAYSMQRRLDGSLTPPRFVKFGPLLKQLVRDARANRETIEQTARRLGMQKPVFRNAMRAEGVAIDEWADDVGAKPRSVVPTPREQATIELLADGWSVEQTASELGISTRTVQQHRRAAMLRLGLRTPGELIEFVLTQRQTMGKVTD